MKHIVCILGCLLALTNCGQSNNDTEKFGALILPKIAEFDDVSVSAALAGIAVTPQQNLHLSARDKQSFLTYLKQVCAVAQLKDFPETQLSDTAPVWRILSENFPRGKEIVTKARRVDGSLISLKEVADPILTLPLE